MCDDVAREIKEILDRSRGQQQDQGSPSGGIVVGDIVGNSGTVVIGNNNSVDIGRRDEDKPGADNDSHGRRASDSALREELCMLRQQVQSLKRLVKDLYARCTASTFKHRKSHQPPCLASTVSTAARPAGVSIHAKPPSRSPLPAEPRATTGSARYNPPQPTLTRLVSILVAPNSRIKSMEPP